MTIENGAPSASTLNAMVALTAADDMDAARAADQCALEAYLTEVTARTAVFADNRARLAYLRDEGYLDASLFAMYSMDTLVDAFDRADRHPYQFGGYIGAR